MNKVILMGRLTRDPEVRYSQGEQATAIARYTLAVDRRFKRDGDQTADFIGCVAFGKLGEFAEKYLRKGTKVVVTGRIQTGSYTNKDGQKVYTTDVVVEECEFAESKNATADIATLPTLLTIIVSAIPIREFNICSTMIGMSSIHNSFVENMRLSQSIFVASYSLFFIFLSFLSKK
jgi:single-strand DNA-binding protein